MNRIIIKYFLSFLAVLVLVFFISKETSPFGKNNTSFAVDRNIEITRIEFLQEGKTLSLEKSGEKWMVNNTEQARKSTVLFLIRTLREIKIKSPVSTDIYSNEIEKKGIVPVQVNVYKRKRSIKSFFVYKTKSNLYGNIMKMRKSSKPFIVYIPGYEDNIGTHFTLNKLFWQPYMVLNLLPSQIASVELEYFSDSVSSFKISNEKSRFTLSDRHKNLSGWDSVKVKRYLTYFISIPFETWAFDLTGDERKNIESQHPAFRITVKKEQGEKVVLTLWEKWNSENGKEKKDTDRVWAKTDSNDNIFIMRYFDIDPVLKKKSYFFTE